MISRRNIRIKVIQALYSQISTTSESKEKTTIKCFKDICHQTEQLGVSYLQLTKQILEYCIFEQSRRSSKYLPTAADLSVSLKPASNAIAKELNDNTSFHNAVQNANVAQIWDADHIKGYYLTWKETESYKTYIAKPTTTREEDKQVFLEILETLFLNEDVASLAEYRIFTSSDDDEMIAGWIVKNMDKLESLDFENTIDKAKIDFGVELISTFYEKSQHASSLIIPKLLNWDPERIAAIDMLILQLGLCELLYFPTIPTKVTINEYIDIAKLYSTLQSGNFVNGVLDKIHKDLINENKINKISKDEA